ncbi:Hypothetical predicted protein [Pelobates cultripes]|uniref:Uncharacterized protein n=1 Tax=Pelobates cultripes TaxID=61616 RepID=A0AAD1SCU1_PELCU|nr:Hypothetical predicted protein [Pelobates cultripes]
MREEFFAGTRKPIGLQNNMTADPEVFFGRITQTGNRKSADRGPRPETRSEPAGKLKSRRAGTLHESLEDAAASCEQELTQESASFLDKRFSSWIVESQADYAGLRCQSLPSTDSQEEAELTYVVPHPLLQLSISSSSTESTLPCAQNMPMDWLNYKEHFSSPTEMGVNNSTPEAVNSGAFFVEISAQPVPS